MLIFKTDWRHKSSSKVSLRQNLLSPILYGKRVTLKPPMPNDYPQWEKVRRENEEFLKPYEPTWPKDSLTQKFFERRIKRQAKDRRSGVGAYFLIHHNGHIIGGINLNNIQMGAACYASLGYWLDENVQGHGYMNEAVDSIIDYAFNTLKFHRLNAACLPHNDRSMAMLMKLGFEKEGYAKRYLQINGHWQDHVLFGLCAPTKSG